MADLAVNTAASGNNAAAIQSLDDRVTAELASKLDSSALAPAIAPLATAAALATTDGQVAAHAALQSSLTTGLSNKADQSAFDVLEGVVATKSTPDGVDLKLSNYSTTAAMNGSIASANNATLATVAANYGLKTVVDQHSLDIAARITPLEVDTKVANALLGAVTAAALASELASRDASISGLQASKADASALTAYALQSAVDFTVPPNGVAKLHFGAHFQAPGLPNQTAGTVQRWELHHGRRRVHGHADGLRRSNRSELRSHRGGHGRHADHHRCGLRGRCAARAWTAPSRPRAAECRRAAWCAAT